MTIEELKVVIKAETSELTKAVKDVKSQTAGLTKEVAGAKNEIKNLAKETKTQTENMGSAFKKVGKIIASVFSVRAVYNFLKECVSAASEMESAYTGLQSIMDGQGRSFADAQSFIQSYTRDGLVPATNAINAYKNLAMRGYDDSQIRAVMTRLKDAAAFGRQASYSLGQAVETATEGLKNENSILVDNAGVTKNVAKMWEDYAKSIGVSSTALTQQQKIQAEVAGILEETKYQVGDSAKVLGTYQGKLLSFQATLYNLKVSIGQAFMPILSVVLPILTALVNAIRTVVVWVTALFSVLFGKKSGGSVNQSKSLSNNLSNASNSTNKLADGTSNVSNNLSNANKSASSLKKSLMGFDEINNLSGNGTLGNPNSGVGGATGGSIDTSGLDEWSGIMAGLDSQIESIKKKLEGIAPILEIIGIAAGVLGASAFISFLIKAGSWAGLKELVDGLVKVNGKTGEISKLGTAINIVRAAFSSMNPIVLAVVTAITLLVIGIKDLWDNSESFRTTCQTVWGQIKTAVLDAKEKIWTEGLEPLINELGLTCDSFTELYEEYVRPVFSWIMEHIVSILGQIITYIITFVGNVITEFAKIATGITTAFNLVYDFVSGVIGEILAFFKGEQTFTATIAGIKDVTFDTIKQAWETLKDTKVVKTIGGIANKFFTKVKTQFESVKDHKAVKTIGGIVNKYFKSVKKKFNNLKSNTAKKTISGYANKKFKSVKEKWDALKSKTIKLTASVTGAITNLKELVNDKIIAPINANIIATLRKVPGLGKLPNIPKLARGGIVDTKTLFYAGEAGQEVVMPLENNTGWITKLANMINQRSGSSVGGNDTPVEITLQIGNTKFGRAVISSINALQAQEGKILINL